MSGKEKNNELGFICVCIGVCMYVCMYVCRPMMIFPRVRMKPELIDKAPNGTIGVATKSGWVNEQTFLEWFDHFTNNVIAKS